MQYRTPALLNPTPPLLIGLVGSAGAGKDTVRTILEQYAGYKGLAFADPIRAMLCAMLAPIGIGAEWTTTPTLKEIPIPGVGLSYRRLAQTLGTEWGRTLDRDLWTRMAGEAMTATMLATHDRADVYFVISDVRFASEAQWVRNRGGVLWRIARPNAQRVHDHVSERECYGFDVHATIANTGTLADLHRRVLSLVTQDWTHA